MEKPDVKINYLYNSGFAVETANYLCIFDYWKDGRIRIRDLLDTEKKVIVFVSHSHGDHYNTEIFKWLETTHDIEYILSSGVRAGIRSDKIHRLGRYKELSLKGARIKTFGSTDMGVSFLVEVDGITLFHAGDLNWWHWYDETEENNRNMAYRFKNEIVRIKEEKIDIAFFPVDPRLKESYKLGAEYFIKEVMPSWFIPMHYGENTFVEEEFPDLKLFSSEEGIEK
ncbi:MAG: MBL fold metallo-hydrolase [Clostridiaceae bacterium]